MQRARPPLPLETEATHAAAPSSTASQVTTAA